MEMTEKLDELQKALPGLGKLPTVTRCAHIFSESTNANIASSDEKEEYYVSDGWNIIECFGLTLPEELNGVNVHRLENVMTMSYDMHQMFDRLYLWFKATDTPNKYELCVPPSLAYYLSFLPKTVTFKNHATTLDLPLPSPTYLKIHAACASIAHLSGAAEHINKILREMEDTIVLSEDGSSAEMLKHAILALNP